MSKMASVATPIITDERGERTGLYTASSASSPGERRRHRTERDSEWAFSEFQNFSLSKRG